MPVMRQDADELMSYEEKEALLKEIHQEDIIDLFKKNAKSAYQAPKHNSDPLDQSITIAITSAEKDIIASELKAIRKAGGRSTVAAFGRNRTTIDLDVIEWRDRALQGVKELNGPDWTRRSLESKKQTALRKLSKLRADDNEGKIMYQKQVKEYDRKLSLIERPEEQRKYRIKIRYTYSEAKKIRWRASRLSLTIADYIRFIMFNYLPYSKDDKGMSVNYRRKFYVSIMAVARNGWGTPPDENVDPNTAKYIEEINELRRKNERLRNALTPRQREKLGM